MSKTVPVHARSSRPSSPVSPASALLPASRRLTASPVALPVHDVSTTRTTTQKLPSARADWPEVRPGGCNLPITLRHDRLSVPHETDSCQLPASARSGGELLHRIT